MEMIISFLNGVIKGGWIGMALGIILHGIKIKKVPSGIFERLIIVEGAISIFLLIVT